MFPRIPFLQLPPVWEASFCQKKSQNNLYPIYTQPTHNSRWKMRSSSHRAQPPQMIWRFRHSERRIQSPEFFFERFWPAVVRCRIFLCLEFFLGHRLKSQIPKLCILGFYFPRADSGKISRPWGKTPRLYVQHHWGVPDPLVLINRLKLWALVSGWVRIPFRFMSHFFGSEKKYSERSLVKSTAAVQIEL